MVGHAVKMSFDRKCYALLLCYHRSFDHRVFFLLKTLFVGRTTTSWMFWLDLRITHNATVCQCVPSCCCPCNESRDCLCLLTECVTEWTQPVPTTPWPWNVSTSYRRYWLCCQEKKGKGQERNNRKHYKNGCRFQDGCYDKHVKM